MLEISTATKFIPVEMTNGSEWVYIQDESNELSEFNTFKEAVEWAVKVKRNDLSNTSELMNDKEFKDFIENRFAVHQHMVTSFAGFKVDDVGEEVHKDA
jgi:hypothetical protein